MKLAFFSFHQDEGIEEVEEVRVVRVYDLGVRVLDRTAFIPFLCAGDPDLETTAEAVKYLSEISADIIELGVPYSVLNLFHYIFIW